MAMKNNLEMVIEYNISDGRQRSKSGIAHDNCLTYKSWVNQPITEKPTA